MALLSEEELDAILEIRDGREFDNAWVEAYQAFGKLKKRWPNAAKIFQQLSAATGGHEIVGYIADDLDLIACYELSNGDDRFMKFLIACYEASQVPGEQEFNKKSA